jgi:hypothetical protein
MRSLTIAALSTLCLAASACQPKVVRSVDALRPDKTNPDRFVCELAGTRPTILPNASPNWVFVGQAKTVAEAVERAKAEFEAYRLRGNERERIVAIYLMAVEDKLFLCFNNMQWQKDFYAGLPE